LENGRSKDDKMSGRMQKAIEAEAGKVRMAETEGTRREERSRKETRREETEEGKEKN